MNTLHQIQAIEGTCQSRGKLANIPSPNNNTCTQYVILSRRIHGLTEIRTMVTAKWKFKENSSHKQICSSIHVASDFDEILAGT